MLTEKLSYKAVITKQLIYFMHAKQEQGKTGIKHYVINIIYSNKSQNMLTI